MYDLRDWVDRRSCLLSFKIHPTDSKKPYVSLIDPSLANFNVFQITYPQQEKKIVREIKTRPSPGNSLLFSVDVSH